MKGGIAAAAALVAMAGGVNAGHRHAHDHLFAKRSNNSSAGETCGCTTVWTTITGAATLIPNPAPTMPAMGSNTTVALVKPSQGTPALPPPVAATTEVTVVPMPTPQPKTFETPGIYTVPATTVTVNQTTTVCAATSTKVPPGIHTIGGVTTEVTTATTLTVPVATISTSGGVTTSTIVQTTYVCPTPGIYTIAPITTSVAQETDVVYPTPTTYEPGIYTAPEQVVTVIVNDYVYYCPFTPVGLASTSPTPTPAPAQPPVLPPPSLPSSMLEEAPKEAQPTTSPAAVPLQSEIATPSPAPSQDIPVTEPAMGSQVALPSAPAPASPSASSTAEVVQPKPSLPAQTRPGKIGSNNDQFGITYTPYNSQNGQCKNTGEVAADIAAIKAAGFTTVRVYSTDCSTLENVGAACEAHGVRMIVGLFVKGPGCTPDTPEIKEQMDKLVAWKKWNLVDLIVMGNEAIMNRYCTAEQLGSLIVDFKAELTGYSGLWTVSETLNVWQESATSSLCSVVDVVGANIHPFFNDKVTPATAGDFVKTQLDLLEKICPGKEAVNLECGWPTQGKCNGSACPGQAEQQQALESIRKAAGYRTLFFSVENDMWKAPGACGCEQSWGSAQSFSIKVSLSL